MRAELFSGICEKTIPGIRSEITSGRNDIQNRFMIMELRNAKIKKTATLNNGTQAVNISWIKSGLVCIFPLISAGYSLSPDKFQIFFDESVAICFFYLFLLFNN